VGKGIGWTDEWERCGVGGGVVAVGVQWRVDTRSVVVVLMGIIDRDRTCGTDGTGGSLNSPRATEHIRGGQVSSECDWLALLCHYLKTSEAAVSQGFRR